jgi:hypothetical protein
MSNVDTVEAMTSSGTVLAFFATQAEVDDLGGRAGWQGVSGGSSAADTRAAVKSFAMGSSQGLAMTYAMAAFGIRCGGAQQLVLVDKGLASAAEQRQAESSAPHAAKSEL